MSNNSEPMSDCDPAYAPVPVIGNLVPNDDEPMSELSRDTYEQSKLKENADDEPEAEAMPSPAADGNVDAAVEATPNVDAEVAAAEADVDEEAVAAPDTEAEAPATAAAAAVEAEPYVDIVGDGDTEEEEAAPAAVDSEETPKSVVRGRAKRETADAAYLMPVVAAAAAATPSLGGKRGGGKTGTVAEISSQILDGAKSPEEGDTSTSIYDDTDEEDTENESLSQPNEKRADDDDEPADADPEESDSDTKEQSVDTRLPAFTVEELRLMKKAELEVSPDGTWLMTQFDTPLQVGRTTIGRLCINQKDCVVVPHIVTETRKQFESQYAKRCSKVSSIDRRLNELAVLNELNQSHLVTARSLSPDATAKRDAGEENDSFYAFAGVLLYRRKEQSDELEVFFYDLEAPSIPKAKKGKKAPVLKHLMKLLYDQPKSLAFEKTLRRAAASKNRRNVQIVKDGTVFHAETASCVPGPFNQKHLYSYCGGIEVQSPPQKRQTDKYEWIALCQSAREMSRAEFDRVYNQKPETKSKSKSKPKKSSLAPYAFDIPAALGAYLMSRDAKKPEFSIVHVGDQYNLVVHLNESKHSVEGLAPFSKAILDGDVERVAFVKRKALATDARPLKKAKSSPAAAAAASKSEDDE